MIFRQYETYKVGESLNLQELIEKYGDKYYFDITYHKNGNVSVFFGSSREEEKVEE